MKISIDGILGSAKQINNQRKTGDETSGKKKSNISSDTLKIESKVNHRIDQIQVELKDIQSSLTRNQIINNGIKRLQDDLGKGAPDQAKIIDEVRFEGKQVLREFAGDSITGSILQTRQDRVAGLMQDDVTSLTKLQVEVENILASNLVQSDRVDEILSNLDSSLSNANISTISNMSHLRADAVMRLIR